MTCEILFVSSPGGHNKQAEILIGGLIRRGIAGINKVTFSSKFSESKTTIPTDFSITDFWLLFPALIYTFNYIKKNKPKVIVSTGAAPGVPFVLMGWLFGINTVWIDSIANPKKITMSGKIASLFATRVYTQWPELASGKVKYIGSIL